MTTPHTLTAAQYRYGIRSNQTEAQICIEFMRLVNLAIQQGEAALYLTVFHIPNGQRAGGDGKLRAIQGGKDKQMGALKGAPDYCAFWWGGGMFLEAKTTSGRQTAEQRDFAERCALAGHKYRIFRSAVEGIEILTEQGAIRPNFMKRIGE